MRVSIPLAFISAVLGAGACADDMKNDDAAKAIALSRETTATYSVYSWNVITRPNNSTEEEWSAEFHQGSLHRVETPRDRIIADCARGTGAYLQVASGEIIRGPQVAKAACGIQANSKILEARIIADDNGAFGHTRTVLIKDPEYIRTYVIADNGALVAATIDDLVSNHLLKARAVQLVGAVQDGIFIEESLQVSAVPESYRSAPKN